MKNNTQTNVSCILLLILVYFLLKPCLCGSSNKWKNDPNYFTQTVRMPNAISHRELDRNSVGDNFSEFHGVPTGISHSEDALLCHAQKLDEREAYILKYEPHATKEVAHHMMVYGCGKPGSDHQYWPCGEMDDKSNSSVCADGEREIIFAWALDGTSRELPEGVGFRVGGSTRNRYVVIQLHYKNKFGDGEFDDSGVTLHMTHTPQPKQAGYYVLANVGYVPPNVKDYHVESACNYKGDTIYPIAYRTHSHNLGVVTSGYRIRNNTWTEIGRMSPQLPQTFYNVTNPGIDVKKGDLIAARCTMDSDREFPTNIGPENKDEMCNFYILYYTYTQENINLQYCMRDTRSFKWSDYLTNIPEGASSLEGIPHFIRTDPFVQTKRGQSKRLENTLM